MGPRLSLTPQRGPYAQRGVSLVEALVALLVLSIGMLGIAGLFVESVRNSRSALLRSQAVNLVADMADRIRANAGDPATQGCAPSSGDTGNNCSPAERAQDDLAPVAAGSPERYQITVAWREPGEPEPYSYRSDVLIMPRGPLT